MIPSEKYWKYVKTSTIGEHYSVGEELLNEVSEIEQKCRAVEKAVEEGYYTLPEALSNYRVSDIDYVTYVLYQNRKKIRSRSKQKQIFETINVVISVYSSSVKNFTPDHQKALNKIRKIAEESIHP